MSGLRHGIAGLAVCGLLEASATTLFFAGDSTLHSRHGLEKGRVADEERCLGSWCDELEAVLKPGCAIVNIAYSGTSTKSFRDTGRWEKLIAQVKPGDFVYIQFGHNDQKKDPKRHAPAEGAYRDNLRRFAEEVRAKGGKPIFGTSLVRRFFSDDGRVRDGLEGYPDAVRAQGKAMGVPVVDFNAFSRRLVESADRDESLAWYRAFLNKTDFTHLTRYGAKVMARAFYDEVKRGDCEVASLFRDDAAAKLLDAALPLTLGSPFTDGMVLQRDREVNVWGVAGCCEIVTVSFGGTTIQAVAKADGRWRLKLPPMAASGESRTLVVKAGSRRVSVRDVVVGEVWLASGQSNMDVPLVCGDYTRYRDRQGALVAQMTHKPLVRFARATGKWQRHPLAKAQNPIVWKTFTPENLMKNGSCSAVAAYFALDLHAALGVPVGLLCAYVGGTNIDAWTPAEGTASRPDLKDIAEWTYYTEDNWPKTFNTYPWRSPTQQPAVLWNGLVAPLAPYSCRGMIWYQGCHNYSNGEWQRYGSKMHALFDGWKMKFENDDFVIRFVQLGCSFGTTCQEQAKFEREEPAAAMAVICDVANPDDIHPNEKETVGRRLAAHALRRDYGFTNIQDNSPTVAAVTREGTNLVITCRDAKSLYIYNDDRSTKNNFEIAGADGAWKRATIVNCIPPRNAKGSVSEKGGHIAGNRIVLCAAGVTVPKKVRYWYAKPYYGAIYNEVNLPLGPFAGEVASVTPTELANVNVRLSFDAAGFSTQLVENVTGRVLANGRAPFVSAICKGSAKPLEPESLTVSGAAMTWRFPKGAGEVVLDVTPFAGGWTFQVRRVSVGNLERLLVGGLAGVTCTDFSSATAQCVSDARSGIALRGYEYVSKGVYGAKTHLVLEADRPLEGRKFGFAAGPRAELRDALKAMTVASGFPHTTAGGAWSTESEQCRGSYLNADATMDSLDAFIDAALLGGFDVVHFRENWYACRGHYPVNTNSFPRGLADLKAAVAKVHAAGLRAGLHTLTGCIDPRDPWVTPVCSSNLMNWATYTLAEPLADGATELLVNEMPSDRHDVVFTYSGNGNALRLGGEIIQYAGVRRTKPYAFTGLTRGAFKTRVAPHARGEMVAYLQQRYNAFYPDPDSTLAHELADSIGTVYRTCGFDQVYLDGTEGMMTDYGMAKMRALIYTACTRDGRPCLAEDSHGGGGAGAWWFHSRKGAWDSTYWAPKRFHDFHVARMRDANPRMSEFRELQMGWWNPCTGTDDYRAHAEDDTEYYAGKNAALDASMSVAGINPTFRSSVCDWYEPANFQLFGNLAVLGWYERFRRAGVFQPWLLDHLAVPRQEARLRQDADGVWRAAKLTSRIHRVAGSETAAWQEAFAERPSAALVRIEALGTCGDDRLTGLAAETASTLFVTSAPAVRVETPRVLRDPERGTVAVFRATNGGTSARGAWASLSRTFAPYAKIGNRRAIVCWVKGDGSGALANFQVQSPREYGRAYSEHYVRLDFTGWRLVEMPFSETDVESYCDYVWPYAGGYAPFFHRKIRENAVSAVSVYLNEIPAGKSAEVAFGDIQFAPKTKLTMSNLSLTLNGVRHEVPFALATGEYAEYADGVWTHLDLKRTPLRRVKAARPISLAQGANACSLAAECTDGGRVPRAEVTLFACGEKTPALVDLTALAPERRAFIAREATMPVLYAPADGFDTLPALTMRPNERAEPVVTVCGPIGPFELTIGSETRRLEALAKDDVFTTPRGTFGTFSSSVPVRLKPLDATPARAMFRFTKVY